MSQVFLGRRNPLACELMWIAPEYCSQRPLFILIFLIVAFVGMSLVGILGSFASLSKKWQQVAVNCISTVCVVPAYLLALLGPVVLIYVETGFR
jgi:hypothetical protein